MSSVQRALAFLLCCACLPLMAARCLPSPNPCCSVEEELLCRDDADCADGACVTHPDVCLTPDDDTSAVEVACGWCVVGDCGQVITPAVDPATGQCAVFPNTCIPPGWTEVDTCASETCLIDDDCGAGHCRTHPDVCLAHGDAAVCAGWCVDGCGEAESPAVDPGTGACVVFPDTCTPPGWQVVAACPAVDERCERDEDCAPGQVCPIPPCCEETPAGLDCDDSCDQRRQCTAATCLVDGDCGDGACRSHPDVCLTFGDLPSCAGWCLSQETDCAEVITPASDPQTGQCVTFPDACIPPGWTPSCDA